MNLSVMALDYDGAIAHGDALNPPVREAIAFVRRQGIVVLPVTVVPQNYIPDPESHDEL